ncbi:MAG: V-type ATP synthase subunit D [Betaproteobacteria bacterium]|nr:V-type ATP synthase subunit D [Betaproteobacteria bacterium]
MSEITPTRSAVIERKEERHAMHEGYVFLDEKTMLLAGEIVRQLREYEARAGRFVEMQRVAVKALASAITQHGLEGLQVYPQGTLDEADLSVTDSTLMGVRLLSAEITGDPLPPVAPADASPEAEACRKAYVALLEQASALAALTGNLERLFLEYKRASRRARALQDVLLPELDRDIVELETRLEELEQEDAIWMRRGVRTE